MSPLKKSHQVTTRLRHLLLNENYGWTSGRNTITKEPISFRARSVRSIFGRANEIDDPDLLKVPIWPEIVNTTAVETAPLGPAFSEEIDEKDTSQLVRRLVYLWEEEDLRVEIIGSRAIIRLKMAGFLDFFKVLAYHRGPTELEVLRWVLRIRGWIMDEQMEAPEEVVTAAVAKGLDESPMLLAGADDALLERMRGVGLLSKSFKPWIGPVPWAT